MYEVLAMDKKHDGDHIVCYLLHLLLTSEDGDDVVTKGQQQNLIYKVGQDHKQRDELVIAFGFLNISSTYLLSDKIAA